MAKEKHSKLDTMRHSSSHLMAMAVLQLFPKAKFAIGPSIEDGFYYDFELDRSLTNQDLKKIEKIMTKTKSKNHKFEHEEWTITKAEKYFKDSKQKYKLELIRDLLKEDPKLKKVSIFKTGEFVDLCAGPHVKSTKEIGPYKLLSVAGAYWRGSEKNKMLQRIYGTCFEQEKELVEYLNKLEEAKKRDHRFLGKQLELFMIDEEVGQGLILWLPKGAQLRKIIQDFAINTYLKNGYKPVYTPHIASTELFKHSGHLDFYKENLYSPFEVEKQAYMVKPMNCPFHVRMYNNSIHSYRDLPIRWTEMGTVYRYERSGVLHGLTRVRGFTQDDAHIICTKEQLSQELFEALKLTKYMLKTFGFNDFEVNISIRDPKNKDKFIGDDSSWKAAEESLIEAVKKAGFKNFVYDIGGAVFYGPKIDIKIADALGRMWQLSTIQVDFNLPSRFNMKYIDKEGNEKAPFMIHRALLGSLERFIGVLIEHYAGSFPLWLSPLQVKVLAISQKHNKYAQKVLDELTKNDIRVEVDDSDETLGKKIRNALKEKVPYMVIVGDKEKKLDKVAPRTRTGKDLGAMKISKFIDRIKEEIKKNK